MDIYYKIILIAKREVNQKPPKRKYLSYESHTALHNLRATALAAECLPSTREVLSSNPSTTPPPAKMLKNKKSN
jgi:hypothetical protein